MQYRDNLAAREMISRLSDYFTPDEFKCHCPCGQALMDDNLVIALDNLRHVCGFPLVLESAYRCPTHNKQVGGQPYSYHLRGMAVDIKIRNLTSSQLGRLVQATTGDYVHQGVLRFNGFGMGDGKLHIDIRDKPESWTYPYRGH